jgi:hypothetical protein
MGDDTGDDPAFLLCHGSPVQVAIGVGVTLTFHLTYHLALYSAYKAPCAVMIEIRVWRL